MKKLIIGLSIFVFILSNAITADINNNTVKDGVIRVGTTGDYPPITYYDAKSKKFSGIAITMAEKLGKYLNKKVIFVKTTWPTLSEDLKSNKFDIAMGGISYTPARAEDFLLTKPVEYTGKSPLIRKADKNKYKNLKDIDQPGVRVVENLGGTNLLFAKKVLHHAKIITVPQNNMTFEYLLNKKADVMFTDNVEAVYREKIMPELYAVDPDRPYTHTAKVYMLNKNNKDLLKEVNDFIKSSSSN